jgi:5'-nucleotidase (lipoprotein e(P4) family)
MRRVVVATMVMVVVAAGAAHAQAPVGGLTYREVKYVRDSEEYATITRATYRAAARAVEAASTRVARGQPWAVMLDVDETTLDNTGYEMERRVYQQPHDETVFAAWIARRESGVVPGVQDFIAAVRRLGGRVAWNTNRLAAESTDTRANLERWGLWNPGDRLCLLTADTAYTKAARRAEVVNGTGACSWNERVSVLAFVGDQLGDFPQRGESDADAGRDEAFGVRYFLLPNPMYGAWERRVTRRR